MPDATLNYTVGGWPYMDAANFIDRIPTYTEQIAVRLDDLDIAADEILDAAARLESAWAVLSGGTALASIRHLEAFQNRSLRVALASDSTGNNLPDWPYLWLDLLSEGNPGIRVDHRTWNSTTETLGATETIQVGGSGVPAQGGEMMEDTFNRTGNVVGSTSSGGQVWDGAGDPWTMNGSSALPPAGTGGIGINAETPDATVTVELNITATATAEARSVRVYLGTIAAGAPSGQAVWANITMQPSGDCNLRLYKTIDSVASPLSANSARLVPIDGVTRKVTITLALSIQNVQATIVTPTEGTINLSGTITESDVGKLGSYAGISAASNDTASSYSLDYMSVETPFTPAQPPPGITLINGSVAGSRLSYHSARLAAMFPAPIDIMIISTGHNNGTQAPAQFTAEVSAFITQVKAAHPDCKFVLMSQNPQFAPAGNPSGHANRQAVLRALAASGGHDYVGVFEAFASEPGRGQSLINPDGVHPSTPPIPYDPVDGYGATFWAKAFQDAVATSGLAAASATRRSLAASVATYLCVVATDACPSNRETVRMS